MDIFLINIKLDQIVKYGLPPILLSETAAPYGSAQPCSLLLVKTRKRVCGPGFLQET